MSATPTSTTVAPSKGTDSTGSATTQVSVLLYSDDFTVRDTVRAAVGRRPARDVEVTRWLECATGQAVLDALRGDETFDVLVLDGEATPTGGMGLTRQLNNELDPMPPVLVLIGRPQDAWLAGWSLADAVVSHPLDPVEVAAAVADLARGTGA